MELNPVLASALSSNSIVYVFGAGISSSLTGRNYGWWQWIFDGIHHMKDSAVAKALEDSINADGRTDNLIDVVGKVIESTKSDGTYDAWMQGGFESIGVVNTELAETLRLLKLPQDIFITTNYDSLLEKAAGIGTYTKDDSGRIFKMLESGICSSVVHIHGAYSSGSDCSGSSTGSSASASSSRIDNIVATKEQYDALYNDEGAQFIQNLLGTRTLVFIGCGQTTEDKNIAHFIRFACAHLGLDVPYFYLKRTGEAAPELPDHFHVVDYGSEYDDLGGFLLQMARYRHTKLAESMPIIGRTVHSDTARLGKYHYANEELGFVGRKAELNALDAFLNDPRQTLWWAITGQGGSGKSRLAYELIKENEHSWFGFFMNDSATADDTRSFRPFCDTIVAIDYVQGREEKTAEWTSILLGKFRQTRFALRIILIERETDKGQSSWYSRLYDAWGKYDRALFEETSFSTVFLALGDLDDNAVSSLIGEVCASQGLPADSWRDKRLREDYHKKFEKLKYRPLFVQLYVEAWFANKCTEPDYDSFEGVVEASLVREQERWLEFFDGDNKVVGSFIRLLIRATAGGELSEGNIPDLYKEDWANLRGYFSGLTLPGKQRKESYRNFLADLTQNFEQEGFVLKTYFPDIINEYMFAYYADDDIDAVTAELWEDAGEQFTVFMQRAQSDFSGNEVIARVISKSSEEGTSPETLLVRLSRLKKRVVKPGETLDSLKENIDKEYEFWHGLAYDEGTDAWKEKGELTPEQRDEASTAIMKFAGLHGCAMQYGALYFLNDMDRCIDEMVAMKGGDVLDILKIHFLEERMNACLRTGHTELGHKYENARRNIFNLTQDSGMEDWSRLSLLQEKRNAMMEQLSFEKIYEAREILNRASKDVDYSSEEEVGFLAGMAAQYAEYLVQFGGVKYENYVVSILDKCKESFPDSVEVMEAGYDGMSALLTVKSLDLRNSLKGALTDEKRGLLLAEARKRLVEIESYGRRIKADTWGIAAGVVVNLVDTDEDALLDIIHKAEDRLLSELSSETAKVWMYCQRRLYELKDEKIPKEIVDQGFAYYLREPTSETTREWFFELLDRSTERDRKGSYLLPNVRDSLAQDVMFNPMYGLDAMEQMMDIAEDPEFQKRFVRGDYARDSGTEENYEQSSPIMDSYLKSVFGDGDFESDPFAEFSGDDLFRKQEPVVRIGKKIGRNDPCPCGSGKKYKYCCGRK